jgi:DNA-directed RNA polymerase alpha subunit
MQRKKRTLRTCDRGHQYAKSSDCPACPVCEAERKPQSGFLARLSAPARRALESNGITTLEGLSHYSEKDILQFHGIGKSSLPKLQAALQEQNLAFKA